MNLSTLGMVVVTIIFPLASVGLVLWAMRRRIARFVVARVVEDIDDGYLIVAALRRLKHDGRSL